MKKRLLIVLILLIFAVLSQLLETMGFIDTDIPIPIFRGKSNLKYPKMYTAVLKDFDWSVYKLEQFHVDEDEHQVFVTVKYKTLPFLIGNVDKKRDIDVAAKLYKDLCELSGDRAVFIYVGAVGSSDCTVSIQNECVYIRSSVSIDQARDILEENDISQLAIYGDWSGKIVYASLGYSDIVSADEKFKDIEELNISYYNNYYDSKYDSDGYADMSYLHSMEKLNTLSVYAELERLDFGDQTFESVTKCSFYNLDMESDNEKMKKELSEHFPNAVIDIEYRS